MNRSYIYVYTSVQLHTHLAYKITTPKKMLTKVESCKAAGPGSDEIWPES